MYFFIRLFFLISISTQAFAFSFDGKWYGTNPCAYFDEAQDVVLVIEDGKAKVDWGEKHNPTKYRGGVYQTDKLGLNSNAGRIEGKFTSLEELILNKDGVFTNSDGETINCQFTLTKNEIKKEEDPEEVAKQKAIEEEKQKEIAEEEQKNIILENIPEWYLELPDGGNLFGFFVGMNEHTTIQDGADRALEEARETLASSLSIRIQQQLNKMVDEVRLGNDITLTKELTEITKATTNLVDVSGWKEVKKAIQRNGDNWIVYVLIKYRYSDANKILLDQIKTKEESAEKLKASKAFQELEEEVINSS